MRYTVKGRYHHGGRWHRASADVEANTGDEAAAAGGDAICQAFNTRRVVVNGVSPSTVSHETPVIEPVIEKKRGWPKGRPRKLANG